MLPSELTLHPSESQLPQLYKRLARSWHLLCSLSICDLKSPAFLEITKGDDSEKLVGSGAVSYKGGLCPYFLSPQKLFPKSPQTKLTYLSKPNPFKCINSTGQEGRSSTPVKMGSGYLVFLDSVLLTPACLGIETHPLLLLLLS